MASKPPRLVHPRVSRLAASDTLAALSGSAAFMESGTLSGSRRECCNHAEARAKQRGRRVKAHCSFPRNWGLRAERREVALREQRRSRGSGRARVRGCGADGMAFAFRVGCDLPLSTNPQVRCRHGSGLCLVTLARTWVSSGNPLFSTREISSNTQ
jgi:hypothetical protein